MTNENIKIGDISIAELFQGNMGIKQAYIGDTLIYERPGGYFYLALNTIQN